MRHETDLVRPIVVAVQGIAWDWWAGEYESIRCQPGHPYTNNPQMGKQSRFGQALPGIGGSHPLTPTEALTQAIPLGIFPGRLPLWMWTSC